MRVRDKEIDWSSEDGKTLQQSLVLSEIEQVFGLARSILLIKTHKLFLNSLYPPVTLMTIYGIGQYLNQRMNLYARPLAVGGKIYLICVEIDLFNSLYLFISFDAGCTQYWAHLATDYIPLWPTLRKFTMKLVWIKNWLKWDQVNFFNEIYRLRFKILSLTLCFFFSIFFFSPKQKWSKLESDSTINSLKRM